MYYRIYKENGKWKAEVSEDWMEYNSALEACNFVSWYLGYEYAPKLLGFIPFS